MRTRHLVITLIAVCAAVAALMFIRLGGFRRLTSTDLTTGAITGVVARLERAGYLQREPDPHDRRQQILSPVLERMRDIQHVFGPIRNDVAALLERFDTQQLTAIAEFLTSSTDLAYRHVALLRAQATAQTPDLAGTTGQSVQSPIPVGSEPKTRQAHKEKAKP